MSPHAFNHPSAGPVGTAVPGPKLRVDLLGPVVVTYADADVTLSPLELNLLVILALTPGVAVSTDQLIDDLWGARLPTAPRSRLQGLISGLRRKIGDVVRTRYPGYVIDPARLERDIDECEALAAAARESESPAERLRLLAAAQDVWRGDPLVGISTPGAVPERTRLCEQRLGLIVARGEAELAIGNHRGLVGFLAPVVAQHPLAEQLAGLYITALYRSNRQADALAAYQSLRVALADELGADIGPELQDLHTRILRGEALSTEAAGAIAPMLVGLTPAQLPPADRLFLGREDELRVLDAAVPSDGGVLVVSAPGGLGKTALVVDWAHRAAPAFPDGQLFLDLAGGRRSPEEVVAAALVGLGLGAAELPADLGDLVGLYRTMACGRRLLVVADDAGTAEQVLAVVPPGPGSQLVVTSRLRLVTLSAHHAVTEIVLGPLEPQASSELLRRVVGADRLVGQSTVELEAWCGGWPWLLRHAAAKLAMRPSESVAAFVAGLDGDADSVVLDDPRSVCCALSAAYALLSPDAARLFERLGLVTGEFCLHLAAVAAGTTVHRVRHLLDELVGVNLVVEGSSGEFRYHEVVGRFARRLASAQEWTLVGWSESAGCPECQPRRHQTVLAAVPLREPVSV